MKYIIAAVIVASLTSTAFAAHKAKPQHYMLPDQSGKMTIACYGKPHVCDWHKYYCTCNTQSLMGYGY